MEFFKFYKDKDRKEIEINNVSEFSYLLSPRQSRFESMFITMIGMLLLVGLALFNYLKVYGEEQEQEQPTISICQEELNETKCNEIEPVCPETFPGCVGNSSSSSSKP
jgi:hypothetical protein